VTPTNAEHDVTAPYKWGGFYIGPQLGWGGLVTEGIYNPSGDPFDVANEAIDLTGVSRTGAVGGGQVGVNWQRHSMVLGVEGDVSAVDWAGKKAEFANPGQSMSFDSDVLATLRGRVGWAQDDLLFYVTGGLAFATAELDNTHNQGGKTKNLDTFGGAAGLGMEWGVTRNFSVKTEGLFLALDKNTSIEDIGSEGDPGDFFLLDDGFVARIGANWQFNSGR
jgi:outer membrane immunogenic protein